LRVWIGRSQAGAGESVPILIENAA